MKNRNRFGVLALSALAVIGLAGCQSSSGTLPTIYFLNFKPEIADAYDAITKENMKRKPEISFSLALQQVELMTQH